MPECSGHSGKYFNYDCYIRLRNYYDNVDKYEGDKEIFRKYMSTSLEKVTFESPHYKLFEKLSHRLAGDGIFLKVAANNCCSYINYWLNNEIARNYIYLRDDNFQNFTNFAKSYAEDRKSHNIYNRDSCETYLKPLYNEDNYNRTTVLYEMYDLYNLTTRYYAENNKQRICDYYSTINRYYKDMKEAHPQDTELNEKLKYFKHVVHTSEKSHKTLCGYDVTSLMVLPEDIKPVEVISETPVSQLSTLPDTDTQTSNELERSQTESVTVKPAEEFVESPHPELESPSSPLLQTLPSELQAAHLRDTYGTSESYESSRRALEGVNLELSQNTYAGKLKGQRLKPGSDYTEGLIYNDTLQNPHFSKNVGLENLGRKSLDDGFLGKVQGFFTETLGQVEPAPILGVSGGMGALFLLFKYTPVGSYFGGRRGRMHRIPNNFGEYYAGFVPGFAEQDYGNFGNERYNISYRPE
ncbi:PIR protein [Plasmodium vivax]|uniref:VIR protein n=1 Tax=Plasmodium vivax TaxID=5855 RepID=A0A565A6L6_PLAVI|nr:PIR protein [Plasmodium vivax]